MAHGQKAYTTGDVVKLAKKQGFTVEEHGGKVKILKDGRLVSRLASHRGGKGWIGPEALKMLREGGVDL